MKNSTRFWLAFIVVIFILLHINGWTNEGVQNMTKEEPTWAGFCFILSLCFDTILFGVWVTHDFYPIPKLVKEFNNWLDSYE